MFASRPITDSGLDLSTTGSRRRSGGHFRSSPPHYPRPFRSYCKMHRVRSQNPGAVFVMFGTPGRSRFGSGPSLEHPQQNIPATCAPCLPGNAYVCIGEGKHGLTLPSQRTERLPRSTNGHWSMLRFKGLPVSSNWFRSFITSPRAWSVLG